NSLCPSHRVVANAAQEELLVRQGQPSNRGRKRQPFHRFDFVRQFANWAADRSHPPEMNDLRSAAYKIRYQAKKLVHAHVVSGFLGRLALGSGDWPFIRLKLALWQHPRVVSAALDDCHQRLRAVANDDAAGSENRRSCRLSHAGLIADSMRASA